MRRNRLKDLSDKGIDATDAATQGFRSGLQDIAMNWRRDLTNLVSTPGDDAPQKLSNIRYVSNQVRGQLNRLGYDDLVDSFIGKYDDAFDRATAVLDELDLKPQRLSKLDEKALVSLREADYSCLEDIGNRAVQEIAHGVVMNTLAGESRADMIDAIGGQLEGRFKNYAATYADTALVSYDRRVNVQMWTAAGVRSLLYRGPHDIKNRPFCAAHVGKVFTVPEIEGMSNGTDLPVLYYGGGWNCRHVWSPDDEG
jgi:hypothetical protein